MGIKLHVQLLYTLLRLILIANKCGYNYFLLISYHAGSCKNLRVSSVHHLSLSIRYIYRKEQGRILNVEIDHQSESCAAAALVLAWY